MVRPNYPGETSDAMMDVNARGIFFSMKRELTRMVTQGTVSGLQGFRPT